MVVCLDENRGIGYENALLYSIHEDMVHFRKLTLHKCVVYGHNTMLSLPAGTLPDRRNIVLSRSLKEVKNGILLHSVQELDLYCRKQDIHEIYVIGGQQVYFCLKPYATLLHITEVFSSGKADAFFFDYSSQYVLAETSEIKEEKGIRYRFCTYKKRKN